MSSPKLANNAVGLLASGLTTSATSLTLSTGQGARFPALAAGEYFIATIIRNFDRENEIIKVTARAGDVLTIERAQEGTTALEFVVGDVLELRLTAGLLAGEFSRIDTALASKIPAAEKGAANGVATLNGAGLVPTTQLPSYVDDVLEYATLANFPATGETGKIYVALDTNKTYRWSGSAYVEISPSPGTTDSLTEGATNLYFTTARARAALSAIGAVSYNSATGVISAELTSGYVSKTVSANTTLNADTEYETGRNLRINHGVTLSVPSTTLLIVRKYAAGSSL